MARSERIARTGRDTLAEMVTTGRRTSAAMIAGFLERDGITKVTNSEERKLFWQRDPEQPEERVWAEVMAQAGVTPETMTPEQGVTLGLEVSKRVYPWRWAAMAGEGRTPAEQALWAWKHAQQGDPNAVADAAPVDESAPILSAEGSENDAIPGD